jgi:tetratricopeptide (TPR) repeat protein
MKPLEAEYYYNLSKIDQSPLSVVKANYPLSMLYLRHHKFNKLNLEKGKKYLEEAFSIIKSGVLDYLDETEKQFYTVFNRNGYGLVLFKEGKEKKAIDLLNWGLETLTGVEDKHYMHKSVIIYNICQCYKKLMQYDKAIEKYQELLEIDYAFTEYILKWAYASS